MHSKYRALLWLGVSWTALATPLIGQPASTGQAPEASAAAGAPIPTGFVAELVDFNHSLGARMVALAEAIPAAHYGWRPAPEVRSVEEAIQHAAATNFAAVQALSGRPAPSAPADLAQIRDKEALVEVLESSFAAANTLARSLAATDLEQRPGGGQTLRAAMVGHVLHHGEHLGQLIAYARSVGVVPPWSR